MNNMYSQLSASWFKTIMFHNNHPSYPYRISKNELYYNDRVLFYEDPILTKPETTWADPRDISENELKNRLTWVNNKLVALKDSDIKFINGKPRNPIKTGLCGRGLLGKYGPNHAADPIITRFNIFKFDLEFVAVLRKDVPKWAIPGGMVDPGEEFSVTLRREFTEEAASECNIKLLDKIFKNGKFVYSGIVYNDPRTTDDAWIETIVKNYHISYNDSLKLFLTNQNEENHSVKWISCNSIDLYADHKIYIDIVKNKFYNRIYLLLYIYVLIILLYLYSIFIK